MFIVNQQKNAMHKLDGTVKICNDKQIVLSNALGCCVLGVYYSHDDAQIVFDLISDALYNNVAVYAMPTMKEKPCVSD